MKFAAPNPAETSISYVVISYEDTPAISSSCPKFHVTVKYLDVAGTCITERGSRTNSINGKRHNREIKVYLPLSHSVGVNGTYTSSTSAATVWGLAEFTMHES